MKIPKNWKLANILFRLSYREAYRHDREGLIPEEVPMVHLYQHVKVTQWYTQIIYQDNITQSNRWQTGRNHNKIHTWHNYINVQIIKGNGWHGYQNNYVIIMTPYDTDKPFTTLMNQIKKCWKFEL